MSDKPTDKKQHKCRDCPTITNGTTQCPDCHATMVALWSIDQEKKYGLKPFSKE